jgi:hypothetical protein
MDEKIDKKNGRIAVDNNSLIFRFPSIHPFMIYQYGFDYFEQFSIKNRSK